MTSQTHLEPAGDTARRRTVLLGGLAAVALAPLPGMVATARAENTVRTPEAGAAGARRASFITAKDGTEIFYKDWGAGRPIVFSHGLPLNADVWDEQMMFMAAHGFRCVAFDRRGHGRSSQTWDGNDYDTFAEDLAALIAALDLNAAILVGHSAGAGDVARYIGRHGTGRVSATVLASAIPPLMLKTSMQVGLRASYEGIRGFSETDFTQDLKRFDIPTLIVHGEDDQNVPIAATALVSSRLIAKATLKIYPGAPHGLTVTHKDRFDNDLLSFAGALS